MRKLSFVLLGVLLLAAAAGTAYWRHIIEPQQTRRTVQNAPAPQTRALPNQGAPRAAAPAERPVREQARDRVSSFDKFEMAVNILNILVGVAGIWLAVSGIRMQRAAMRMEEARLRQQERRG
jgi:hypothetical protein